MKGYSQCKEDLWILENIELPQKGIFVEVGAGDGVNLSNTKLFEEMGWTGFLVEPDPRQWASIEKHRKVALFKCACGTGLVERAFIRHKKHPDLSGFMRTSDDGEPISVERMGLDSMIVQSGMGHIDLLSIDTEGSEIDVWDSLSAELWQPRVVIIEYNTMGLTSNKLDVILRLGDSGYVPCHETEFNLIFEPYLSSDA